MAGTDDPRARARGNGNAGTGAPPGTAARIAGEAERAPRAPRVRLFAGLWLPPDAVARLASLARPASAGVRWVSPETWHVTLAFLGDVDERRVEGLGAALVSGAAGVAGPPEALLGPTTARLGRSVLAVPVGGLDDLARSVRTALHAALARGLDEDAGPAADAGAVADAGADAAADPGSDPGGAGSAGTGADVLTGVRRDARGARRRAGPASQAFRGHLTLARGRRGRPVPVTLCGVAVEARWTVREVCLVRSELGAGGARYTTLVRATVPW